VIPLRPTHAYLLSGMHPEMWVSPHKRYGTPAEVAGIYLGALAGMRTWHLFEVHIEGKEQGVLLMSAADLERLTITPL
jgi:hypothetical protein